MSCIATESSSMEINALFRELPKGRQERWNVLHEFFAGWYGPICPSHGYSEESIRAAEERLKVSLPAALVEWCALAGRRADVWSTQDRFLSPDDLRLDDQKLVFYVENQGVVRWGLSLDNLDNEDPAVLVCDANIAKIWIEECPAISTFALSRMLLGVKFSKSTQYSANGQATDASIAAIARSYERVAVPDLKWPPGPTRLYGGRDLVRRPS